VISVTVSEIIF